MQTARRMECVRRKYAQSQEQGGNVQRRLQGLVAVQTLNAHQNPASMACANARQHVNSATIAQRAVHCQQLASLFLRVLTTVEKRRRMVKFAYVQMSVYLATAKKDCASGRHQVPSASPRLNAPQAVAMLVCVNAQRRAYISLPHVQKAAYCPIPVLCVLLRFLTTAA